MNALTKISLKKAEFDKARGRPPDICVLPEDVYIDAFTSSPYPSSCDLLMGMEIEIGDELRCKFKTELIL